VTEQNTPAVDDETTAGTAAKPRRRRATRATAPVEAVTESTAAHDEPAAPLSAPDEPAIEVPTAAEPPAAEPPAAPRRRATRSRKAAAPVEETPAEPEALAAPEDEVEEVVVEEIVEPEPEAEAVDEPAQPEPTRAPRLATTAVLFQAPDLTQVRPRRRRATATAGSPEEISQAARHDVAAQATADEEPAEGAPAQESAAEAAPEQPTSRSRSRSRSRRGGRGNGPREEAPAVEETEELADTEAEADEDEGSEAGDTTASNPRRRRRRGGRGRRGRSEGGAEPADEGAEPSDLDDEGGEPADDDEAADAAEGSEGTTTSRRRRRRRRGSTRPEGATETEPRRRDEVTALRGSTRLEAKRQRRREGRDAGRRRQIITEAEFLARRESVDRSMVVRERDGRTQIAVLEDGVLVEHYVSDQAAASMVGNVYLGRVQNVLPSMEAAFVDVGKGRNAVLYAGEVNWDAAGLEGQPRRIEQALKSGDSVLVQVTKDPIGHKGARLTSQVTLAGRYLVYVPGGGMTGISRKLPDTERNRLKKILREIVPDSAGVIVRTAAEGASEEELQADIARLRGQWEAIEAKVARASAPALLQGEPDMAIRVVRDIFNDDFSQLLVQGDEAWQTISSYVAELAPDLAARVSTWTGNLDVFTVHRVDEQLAKGMDRKVWLPSGGSLVIDRTEAMTVIDVNTGKFTGAGGTLEETVTRNNLEAAEEIVRQLRLRDIGGIIVIDFIDMVLESNRDLVLRRLVECLGRDRTKHQVAEVTSLGLVQMTRKRVGQGLVEAFSETCEHCHGRGFIVHTDPVERANPRPDAGGQAAPVEAAGKRSRRKRAAEPSAAPLPALPVLPEAREAVKATLATIAAAAAHAHEHDHEGELELDVQHAPAEPVVEEHARLDVLAELAAHLPVGERHAATAPDEAVLASLAEIAASVTADGPGQTELAAVEAPAAADEAPGETDQAEPVADEAAPEPGEAEPVADQTLAEADEPDEAGALGLAPVDPTLFDVPEDTEDEPEADPEEG
jgi:ribonuclease E